MSVADGDFGDFKLGLHDNSVKTFLHKSELELVVPHGRHVGNKCPHKECTGGKRNLSS